MSFRWLVGPAALLLVAPLAAAVTHTPSAGEVVFATCVAGLPQARRAEVLLDSIRSFGGEYAQAPVVVVVDEGEGAAPEGLRRDGVRLVPLEMPAVARGFLFAHKVYAAAQVEALVAGQGRTLVWMDPETLVLAPPRALDLDPEHAVALRPVFLVNRVGQAPDEPVDPYWSAVYRAAGVDAGTVPVVDAFVKRERIRFYVNCGVVAFRPERGICREWARAFTALLEDEQFRRGPCTDVLHRVFLHQAVVSAVILAQTTPEEREWLPDDYGYPLGQHLQLPPESQARRLEDLACVIYDSLWDERPDWLSLFVVDEPLRGWLENEYRRSLRVTDRILREEGECASYLVLTPAGNVVVDPGGASAPTNGLVRIQAGVPPAAILLTHGHQDHRRGIGLWKGSRDVPVIGQQRHGELLAEQDRMAPFLARRNAVIAGRPLAGEEVPTAATPVELTVQFDDRYSLAVGDLHFELVHTPAETPDAATIWVPELRALFVGDAFFSSFPNLGTPRGAAPRRALEYVQALDTALAFEPELLLPGHGEPVVGAELVRRRLGEYRDAILHVHDAVVEGLNQGKDVYTLMREVTLPAGAELAESYGCLRWAVRGIAESYLGWFGGDTADLFALSATAVYPDLVALAGVDAVVALARERLGAGEAVRALRLTDAALAADGNHRGALEARVEVLRALRAASRNYIEARWLEHDLQATQERLAAVGDPDHSG